MRIAQSITRVLVLKVYLRFNVSGALCSHAMYIYLAEYRL